MLFLECYVVSLQKWRSMWTFPTMYSSGALIPVSVTGKNTLSSPSLLLVILSFRTLWNCTVPSSRVGSEQITYSPYSVGGADYGSVRVGTFMGRRIIQGTASKLANSFKKTREEADDVEFALSTEDAEEEYLCNIPPHRYTPLNRQSLCALSTRSEELVAVLLHAEV